MFLAYDLYALDHNAELQEKPLARLRNRDNFEGARYEVYVGAILNRRLAREGSAATGRRKASVLTSWLDSSASLIAFPFNFEGNLQEAPLWIDLCKTLPEIYVRNLQ
jgi:hypothetical protein